MGRLYVNQTLEKQLRQYCSLNGIEDINAFANRCLSQGFNIIKFGTSPIDNIERESKGIKDVPKAVEVKKEDIKKIAEEIVEVEPNKEEDTKSSTVVRKIRIIKKE